MPEAKIDFTRTYPLEWQERLLSCFPEATIPEAVFIKSRGRFRLNPALESESREVFNVIAALKATDKAIDDAQRRFDWEERRIDNAADAALNADAAIAPPPAGAGEASSPR